MPRWTERLNRHDIFLRTAAFFWGFTFFLFFRYSLDRLYPFYGNYLPLSQFALVLFAIAFVAAAISPVAQQRSPRRIAIFILFTTIVTSLPIYIFSGMGAQNAFLLFPLPLSVTLMLLWYLLARYALTYQAVKIYLLAGIAISLVTGRYLTNPFIPPALALAVIILSHLQRPHELRIAHERLVTLRQFVDLLRYLFLAQALHGILDRNREQLPIVVLLCALGFVAPQLTRLFAPQRPHIRYGFIGLPVALIGLAFSFNLIHYTYWGAIAFTTLAIWEAIYFGKSHEIYLRREKYIAGATIAAALAAYYISTEWLQILAAILVALFIVGTLIYIAKNARKTISVFFAFALIAWGFAIYHKYEHSVTREFFRPPHVKPYTAQIPETSQFFTMLMLQKSTGKAVYTNLLPHELLRDAAWRGEKFNTRETNPTILVAQLAYACYMRKQERAYIFAERSLGLYADPTALIALRRLLDYFGHCDLYLADDHGIRSLRNPAQYILTDAKNSTPLNTDTAAKLISLGRAERQRDRVAEAKAIYEQVYSFYKDDPLYLRDLSALAAARGQVDRQIEVLNTLIALHKDNTIHDKKLLMELYAIKGDRRKSAALAYEVLQDGGEAPLAVFAFLQKLFSEPFDRQEMQSLYQKLTAYQPKTDLEIIKYAGIKRNIEDQLKQNTSYDRKFSDENHRQEYITFPE
ncbi:MAG: hypothetical protein JSR44_13365 [Spirochaetes bacterium]|nr:hypothetical protein [Spirochaetota bacterium]